MAGTGYDYRGGTDFIGALLRIAGEPKLKIIFGLRIAEKPLKIIFGTRDRKWYVIDDEDRDYYTTWSLEYATARDLGEEEARIVSTRGRAI